jgi:branched-chain amino acid transport system substrate-binding protein
LSPDAVAELTAASGRAAPAVPSTANAPTVAPSAAKGPVSSVAQGAPVAAAAPTAPAKTAAAPAAACTQPGAGVAVGQIGNFSGVAGPITAGARTAVAVWAQSVNTRGGVACHPVVVYAVDDGGDTTRAAAEVGRLVAEKHIVALVGTAAILSFNGLIAGVEKAKIPIVGGDLAGFEWNENRWLFPQGSGLTAVLEERLRYAKSMGHAKVAMLYCVEASACTEIADAAPEIAQRAGVSIVSSAPVSLTQTDFTAQCQNAKNAGATGLYIAMDGSSIGRVARSCAALRYTPLLISNGLVISDAQAADPTIRKNTLLTTSSNAPWMRTDTPGQREFLDAFTRYAPEFRPAGMAIVTWAAGKLFEAAIAGLGPSARAAPLDTAAVLAGLGRIRNETLGGLSSPITFSPGQESAPLVRCAYVAVLTQEGWTAPIGSARLCNGRPT